MLRVGGLFLLANNETNPDCNDRDKPAKSRARCVLKCQAQWKFWAGWNLSFWLPGCVFIRVGGGLHIYCIIVAPKGDARPLQACLPSCFISICSYMGIFLPSARLHYVRFLNNPPPPSCLIPTPPQSHTYTLLLMLVSFGQRRECLFPVQEVLWLILIWSPVPMACIHDSKPALVVLFLVGAGSICNRMLRLLEKAHLSALEAVYRSHATRVTLQFFCGSGRKILFDLCETEYIQSPLFPCAMSLAAFFCSQEPHCSLSCSWK